MEDFHGYQYFSHPVHAFDAYVTACRKAPKLDLPPTFMDDAELGRIMVQYYTDSWLQSYGRDPLATLILDGVPQVEVTFEIPIPFDAPDGEPVFYRGTIDRVVVDRDERVWLLDYKTAKNFETLHLDLDPQITAYCWAGSAIYDFPISGMIYQQHKKREPEEPLFLKSGKFSVAKDQSTTYGLYKKALKKLYRDLDDAPNENIRFLNHLASSETEDQDRFVRRDYAYRNQHQIEVEGTKILLELEDILNPNLPLYPSPTRDCSWCSFRTACICMEDGSDWEHELETTMQRRDQEDAQWRPYLQYPIQEQEQQQQEQESTQQQ